jgi:hypothetical protein
MKGVIMTVRDFRPSAATKTAVFVVEVLFWLSMLLVLLSLTLAVTVNLTSFHVKYIHPPLDVCYRSGGGMYLEGQDLTAPGPKIVGFSRPVLENGGRGAQGVLVIMPLLLSMLLLGIMLILRKIIRSIRSGSPFTIENASRIRALGWIVMASGPFYGILEYAYAMMLLPSVRIEGAVVTVKPDIKIFYIFAGLIIVVIGHVFRYGVSLREDSELTV